MVKERQGERSKDLKVFQQMVCAHLQITRTAVSSDQRGCTSAVEKGLGVYHARTMESNKERLESQLGQRLKQVHIRTSPDASPENVDVFVGSDSTDSVTAPCLETSEPLGTGVDTHTHTVPLGGARANDLNRHLKSLRNKRKKRRKSSAKRAREKGRSRKK